MNTEYDKVRIGMAMSGWPFPGNDPTQLGDYVTEMEKLDIDSLWFTDRIVSESFTLEPVVAMSYVAAITEKLKFGTSVIALPLRNPTVLAKEIATLDFISNGRSLPAVGLGPETENDYEACGSDKKSRVGRTEEAVEIMRLLWSSNNVTYKGDHFTLNNVSIEPKPVQKELPPIWFGGRSEPAINRTARIGDGWLVSYATAEEISTSIPKIKERAITYGNHIEDDHYGALISFCFADTRKEGEDLAKKYNIVRREDVDIKDVAAFGPPDILINLLDDYIKAGATKFTLRSACPPEMTFEQMSLLGKHIVPRYHSG
ncbi:MAG: LLM class flavin-dependent oxidoreductase [Dehalococcoidia bacterium]|tara:strand:+ start:688 stop:1632 length:945 start_codon:yes stop_codon:yes gene_type:complete